MDFQVFQRKSATNGILRVEGSISVHSTADELKEVRLQVQVRRGSSGALGEERWLRVPYDFRVPRFRLDLPVPAGGWYAVELQAILGTDMIGSLVVPHVGVGEVFLVAGQSNSANHGEGLQHPKSDKVVTFGGKSWGIANDPQPGASGNGGSFIPALGDVLASQSGVPIGFVCLGAGGTSVREWLPAGGWMSAPPTTGQNCVTVGDRAWVSSGALYQQLLNRSRPFGTNGFRAVLWHQGESDNHQPSGHNITPQEYEADLRDLIRTSRRDLGWNIPWVIAQASYHVPSDPGSSELRAAQRAIARNGFAVEGPNTDVLGSEYREDSGRGVHFNSRGLVRHGELWAEKLNPWLDRVLK
jgi:Carbohydrate esterase, sialic acid-specific acetylesterase